MLWSLFCILLGFFTIDMICISVLKLDVIFFMPVFNNLACIPPGLGVLPFVQMFWYCHYCLSICISSVHKFLKKLLGKCFNYVIYSNFNPYVETAKIRDLSGLCIHLINKVILIKCISLNYLFNRFQSEQIGQK